MLKYFLRIEDTRYKKDTFLSQKEYVLDLLMETEKLGAKLYCTLIIMDIQILDAS